MKTRIFSLCAAFLALSLNQSASADVPVVIGGGNGGGGVIVQPESASPIPLAVDGAPEWLPIGSITVLKSFMQEVAEDSYIGMWSASLADAPGMMTRFQLRRNSDESPSAFAKRTASQRFAFKVLDTRDEVHVDASIWFRWHGSYYPAFEGGASTMVTDLPGGGTGFNMPNIRLQLSNTVYLPAGNLTSVFLVKRDARGEYQYGVNLPIINGLIEFPAQYAGTDGLVVGWAKAPDGSYFQVAYDKNQNGQRVSPISVVGTTHGFLDNSIESSVRGEDGVVNFMFANGIAQWGNTPLVIRLTVTGDRPAQLRIISAILDERDTFIGAPYFATLLQAGDPPSSAQRYPVQDGRLAIMLAPGVYNIGLENPEIWSQYRPQPSPHDGEKGGGIGVAETP